MDITNIEPYINEFLKSVYKSFVHTPRMPTKSRHKNSCKVCGSHPVNSVKRKKVICRVCGTSHRGHAVFSNNGDLHTDTVLLDLRTKI
jgi:ribosomal protein L37AE/L43A